MRENVAIVILLAGLILCVTRCATLTPEAKAQIAKDQIELNVCAYDAHACKGSDAGPAKCWAVFDDCMVRHGFYDGGSDAH